MAQSKSPTIGDLLPPSAARLAVLSVVLALVLVPSPSRARVDIVFANTEDPNEQCLNDGSGAFTCSDVSSDTNNASGVALADFDGVDGIDMIFSLEDSANLLCLNDGTGAFTCSDIDSDPTLESTAVAVADIDGVDGVDIVFGNAFGEESQLCLNDGAGAFTCSDLSSDTGFSFGVALGDVDGVNGVDAVFANTVLPSLVCLNDGTGAFSCSDVDSDVKQATGVALGDVDGVDGLDIVFSAPSNESQLCLNDGTGAFTCSVIDAGSTETDDVAVGDIDGVNGLDIVFANGGTNNGTTIKSLLCLNDGTGAFTCSDIAGTSTTFGYDGVAVGDVDGVDGLDLVFSGANLLCLNDGDGTFDCSDVGDDSSSSTAVALGFLQPPDLTIKTIDGQTTAVPGETLSFVLEVGNAGTKPSTATVSDTFPPELSCVWSCVGDDGATCTDGPVTGDIEDTVNLPLNGTASYFVLCTVDSAAQGTLTNTATVQPTGLVDLDPSNNTATDVFVLTPRANLAITQSDGLPTAVPGSTVTYAIEANNPGPSDVDGAQLSNPFSSVLSCTWTCEGVGGATCTPGPTAGDIADAVDLPRGGAVGYIAVCTIDPAATGPLVNKASISTPAGVPDPDVTNNSAANLKELTPVADVSITKDDGSTWTAPGDPVSYTIVASNPGPSDAPAATVEDDFPPALTECEWSCTPSGGAQCSAGTVAGDLVDSVDLPAGATATYVAACTVDPGFSDDSLSNTATITAPDGVTDSSASNNAATDTDEVPAFGDGFESGGCDAWSACPTP